MITENYIEQYLRETLESRGFKVLKLITPGRTGAMDRMILRPTYWPGPPMFVELKRPKKEPTEYQAAVAIDWAKRGCEILPYVNSLEACQALCAQLLYDSKASYELAINR